MTTPENWIDLLRARAREHPERRAFVYLPEGEGEGPSLTYGELDEQARALAARLQAEQLGGERALLLYPPGLEFLVAFFGCLYAGVVAVPAYPPDPSQLRASMDRLARIAASAKPKVALTLSALVEQGRAAFGAIAWMGTDVPGEASGFQPLPVPGHATAFLQYTSGSTGAPRGVRITHANLLHNMTLILEAFQQEHGQVMVGWLPVFHDMGLIGNVLHPIYTGGTCILMPPVAFLRKPARWLSAITRYRATISGGPNFAFELTMRKVTPEQKAQLDLSSWDLAFNGAEPVRADTMQRFAAAFAECGLKPGSLRPCYGLAEGTLIVASGPKGSKIPEMSVDRAALEEHRVEPAVEGKPAARLASSGRNLGDQEIAIVSPDGARIGEIWVRGGSIAEGYWQDEAATAETFGARLPDGRGPFLRTGDLGFFQDGELYVTGRLKDLVILDGRNLYPQDLERSAEASHPAVRSGCSAAFAVEGGESEALVLVAEVDPRANADLAAIRQAITARVAQDHGARIAELVLLPPGTVPKTSSGKIQRRACRAAHLARALPAL